MAIKLEFMLSRVCAQLNISLVMAQIDTFFGGSRLKWALIGEDLIDCMTFHCYFSYIPAARASICAFPDSFSRYFVQYCFEATGYFPTKP